MCETYVLVRSLWYEAWSRRERRVISYDIYFFLKSFFSFSSSSFLSFDPFSLSLFCFFYLFFSVFLRCCPIDSLHISFNFIGFYELLLMFKWCFGFYCNWEIVSVFNYEVKRKFEEKIYIFCFIAPRSQFHTDWNHWPCWPVSNRDDQSKIPMIIWKRKTSMNTQDDGMAKRSIRIFFNLKEETGN